MSFTAFTRQAVSVFKSSDDGAPQLTANPGSLKTVLEACLISGYGSKQALNWEMPFSNATAAAFKSASPEATGCHLSINQTAPRYAEVRGYASMSTVDSGEGFFAPNAGRNLRFYLMYNNIQSVPWVLVGHGRAFWFLIRVADFSTSALFFGDFPSYAAADRGNCLLFNIHSAARDTALSSWSGHCFIQGGYWAYAAAKSWDGLNVGANLRLNSRTFAYAARPYPDVITGGLQADSIDLHEFINDSNQDVLRGRLPGLYLCAHDLSSINEHTEMDGFDGTSDRFMKLRLQGENSYPGRHHYLLNLSHWVL